MRSLYLAAAALLPPATLPPVLADAAATALFAPAALPPVLAEAAAALLAVAARPPVLADGAAAALLAPPPVWAEYVLAAIPPEPADLAAAALLALAMLRARLIARACLRSAASQMLSKVLSWLVLAWGALFALAARQPHLWRRPRNLRPPVRSPAYIVTSV